ncbi:MAG: nitrite and sulphite reductase 4Fe-4S region [Deltaproteobacteria bacterium]|nr:nitrite and sulphite reductase 4Fe-4S region [Deltaproteobacteria bacterium]
MTINPQLLRLEGVYPQRQKEYFMQRIKLPAGIISAPQALKVAEIADRFARGVVHLTTRGSMELHWLTADDLPVVARQLATVGLISRGACGGAVRGVVCSSLSCAGAPRLEALVRLLHRHFSGNPRFENLPKKFKIAVEADTAGGRHLIQDFAMVPVDITAERLTFNVWVAGGLGREPTPAFLFAEGVTEERIIGLVEAVVRVYTAHTPAGKRLKHLVREIGRDEFIARVLAEPAAAEALPTFPSLSASLVPAVATPARRIDVGVFAGELSGSELAALAEIAANQAGGILLVTGNQNIAFHVDPTADLDTVRQELVYAGLPGTSRRERVTCRVCPGSHECLVGLGPTREIAAELVAKLGPAAVKLTWAISGCPNSCAQPQLADVGIVISRLVNEEGERTHRFDLYRGDGSGAFAAVVGQGLSREELLKAVAVIG